MKASTIYDFSAKTLQGENISLETFRGKTVLIVNTASNCGFTPQYKGLENLYQMYKDDGLVVLGFPCNQFGKQERGSSEEINAFCTLNYGITFPMFEKIEVNGHKEHPLYSFLKSQFKSGFFGRSIKWNFTKFVVDASGKPIKRFPPTTSPEKMERFIVSALS